MKVPMSARPLIVSMHQLPLPSKSGSLAMLLAMRLASFLLNDTDRS